MSLARLLFSKSTSSRELSTHAATKGVSVVPDASAESFSGAPCVSGTCTKVAEQSNIALVRRYTSQNTARPAHGATIPCFISRDLGTVRRRLIERALWPRAGYLMRLREATPEDAEPSKPCSDDRVRGRANLLATREARAAFAMTRLPSPAFGIIATSFLHQTEHEGLCFRIGCRAGGRPELRRGQGGCPVHA